MNILIKAQLFYNVVNMKYFRPAFLLLFAMMLVFTPYPSVLARQISFQSEKTLLSTIGTEEEGEVYITTIEPIADTYVDGKYHWKNYGNSSWLCVWAYANKFISFIKFDLSGISSSANIISAELFLRARLFEL